MNEEELENTKLNLNCPICNKSLYINGELAHTKKGVYHLECYLISKKIFTTSMNREVCWEDGFQKGKLEGEGEFRKIWNDYLLLYLTQEEINKFRVEGVIKEIIRLSKIEQKKEEFGDFVKWLDWLINSPKNTWSKQIKTKLEQFQKEINSQTEQNSDKEVAQPYSKSDKTTKEIGSNSK